MKSRAIVLLFARQKTEFIQRPFQFVQHCPVNQFEFLASSLQLPQRLILSYPFCYEIGRQIFHINSNFITLHQGPIQITERETRNDKRKSKFRLSFRLRLSFLVFKLSHSFLVSFLVQFFSFIVSPIQITNQTQTINEKPNEKRMKFIDSSEPSIKFR